MPLWPCLPPVLPPAKSRMLTHVPSRLGTESRRVSFTPWKTVSRMLVEKVACSSAGRSGTAVCRHTQHRVFAAEGIGLAFRARGIGQPTIVHHEEVFVVAGWQAQFDAPFPLGVGLEMVGLTARKLLSRPPHRKRSERGLASGCEGV